MKSNVSDHLELVHAVYIDACAECPAGVSDLRDLITIKSRVQDEGLSFLTITLPNFCKDFERSLAIGRIDPTCFSGFRKHGAIPAFLQGMLGHIFNRETGRLTDETPDFSTIVGAVRQICLLFKKVEVPCTPEREYAAIANFKAIEQLNSEFVLPSDAEREFLSVSEVLWPNCVDVIHPSELVPRHGPGATAERILGNQKFNWQWWYERLEPYFPFLGSAYSVSASLEDEFEKVTFVPVGQERPVRVVLVPKTLKSPRVIAIEPVCMVYAQQAIRSALYTRIEGYWLTRGHVNFTDQTVNQRQAIASSKTGRFATIDLSDASDRVLHSLSIRMFDSNPDLKGAIEACRSEAAELPTGEVIRPLSKFASMGSALCFPVESMYFYTICVVALLRCRNLPFNVKSIFDVTRDIYVYGDDILVPTNEAGTVVDYLRKYNCKVNRSKSFWTGRFRESCGVDAYAGELVTPIYLRKLRPYNRQQAAELISWVATANLFYLRGYWHVASLMFSTCEKILGPLPYVSPDSSALGRISYLGYRTIEKWNDNYQSWETKAWVPSPVYRCDRVDGYAALQKCLIDLTYRSGSLGLVDSMGGLVTPITQPAVDEHHLERTAQRGAVTLKRRGVPAT